MSTKDKLYQKCCRKPTPNDITYEDFIKLANNYGFKDLGGGKHPIKLYNKEYGYTMPVPKHGNIVGEAYIEQLIKFINIIKDDKEKGDKK